MKTRIWVPIFEGETPPADTPPADTPPADPPATFTQADVDKMMATEKREWQTKVAANVSEIDALRTRDDLTKKDREELDTRVHQLESDLLSKEELASRDKKKIENEHQEVVGNMKVALESITGKYTRSMIARSISDAATAHNGENPAHFQAILGPLASVGAPTNEKGEELEGKEDIVVISFLDKNEEGKEVTLRLSPNDAVKRMAEQDEHLTLFRSKGKGGVGGTNLNTPSGGELDAARLAREDPEAYIAGRKSGEISLNQ